MFDHPAIKKLWIIDDSSPSGVANAHLDTSHLPASKQTRAKMRNGMHVGHKFNNGMDKFYWRVCGFDNGKKIQPLAHRVVWILTHGDIPEGMTVDHIDNNGLNNSISNLRLATVSQQACNRKTRSTNRTGLKGVKITKDGFSAVVSLDGKIFGLGTFKTPEEAHEAYCRKALEIQGLFHRPS